MKWFFIASLASTFVFTQFAYAEYRVFTLLIENKKTNITKTIDSTLDPDQFKTFYPLSPDEEISYIDTWMCKGFTGFLKPHCQKQN